MVNNGQNSRPPLSKVETRIQRFLTLSGLVIEIRWTKSIIFNNGLTMIEEIYDVNPPLADHRIPSSIEFIGVCILCERPFHRDNLKKCCFCGHDYCSDCAGIAKINRMPETAACKSCAKIANTGLLKKTLEGIWEI